MTVKELHAKLSEILELAPETSNFIVREWHANREITIVSVNAKDITLIPFYVEDNKHARNR